MKSLLHCSATQLAPVALRVFLTWFAITIGLASMSVLITPRDAAAASVHALTKLYYKNVRREFCEKKQSDAACGVANRCSKSWTKSGGPDDGKSVSAYAIEEWTANCASLYNDEGGQNPTNKFSHSTHAHHHGGSLPNSMDTSPSAEVAEIPLLPVPGDSATEQRLAVTYTNAGGDSFDIQISSSSFLQVYLGNVDPGDSAFVDWKFAVNGEVSRVRLVGHVLVGGGVSVVPSMAGRFTGLPFTITPYPNGAHVLSFGALHFKGAGTVEGADLEISSGDEFEGAIFPTLSPWGTIILALLLAGTAISFNHGKRRLSSGSALVIVSLVWLLAFCFASTNPAITARSEPTDCRAG